MITVDIKPARRRFGVPNKRKQWKFQIRCANGELLDLRDTYANVGDIKDVIDILRSSEVKVRIHYQDGVKISTLPAVT